MIPRSEWTAVYRAASRAEAEIVRGRLEQAGIQSLAVDHGSSAYPPLAQADVLVRRVDAVRALHELDKHRVA